MGKKLTSYFLFSLIVLFFPIGVLLARSTSDNYIIFGDVFSAGGSATSTSASYSVYDTIGEGVILSATSTSVNYGIKAGFQELNPDEYVTLTVDGTTSATIDLGTLTASAPGTDTHTLEIISNASAGITATVAGATLTSGSDTITEIGATAAASSAGTEQFGINLVANTSPSVGAAIAGTSPLASAADQYNTADLFAFTTGDTIATSTTAINTTTFTVSYIANITSSTEGGTYTTSLTYAATANF